MEVNPKKAAAKAPSLVMNHVAVVAGAAGDAAEAEVAMAIQAVKSGRPSKAKVVRKKPASSVNRENSANHAGAVEAVPADQAVRVGKTRVAAHQKTISTMTVSKKSSSTIRTMKPSIVA